MARRKLILGSRGSELALVQSHIVKDALTSELGASVEIKVIKTSGDRNDHLPFKNMAGKGFFTKELEEALLAGEIDLAVHSLKDMMTTQPPGLKLGAVGFREDRRDLLLLRKEAHVDTEGALPVKPGGIVGTSSVRRECQIAFHNPTLKVAALRGNVPTRIKKLREGRYDAIVIAAAGVKRLRLDLTGLEPLYLDPELFLPAAGQGMLGLQIRSDDPEVETIVEKLSAEKDILEARLERGLLSKFELGCSLPLGVYSQVNGGRYRLQAVLGRKADGKWVDLKEADVTGADMQGVIEHVFEKLSRA